MQVLPRRDAVILPLYLVDDANVAVAGKRGMGVAQHVTGPRYRIWDAPPMAGLRG